ncbi:acetyl-CoA carboxylase biotin carboxyl carrier protein [Aquibacillus halophilus]|uniref:Biotin carboxyl carrier protein of acetyl-CoA carboxylase n=1 Tax=Aquibacillus halophilus TaxID=930132 RepID=A0A6A8DBR8_9BACI|nr:acetyl-CoA carboxylase biotin carboxyl carrier protein [Aquibacillus halophilus]MRH43165.1 acetyl-CoA carboxylase biotin carboxyl carrier protein [Aquibacillus halophilus]
MLNMQEIQNLIKLIDESSIDEFTYESNGTKVSLRKQKGELVTAQPSFSPVPQTNKVSEQTAINAEPKEVPEDDGEQTTDFDYEIVSPMVGTFYAAPTPDKDDYVQIGDTVKSDTVVCIVEAMKLFNEIESEVSGEVVEILAENGELVEYGQPLFRVKAK